MKKTSRKQAIKKKFLLIYFVEKGFKFDEIERLLGDNLEDARRELIQIGLLQNGSLKPTKNSQMLVEDFKNMIERNQASIQPKHTKLRDFNMTEDEVEDLTMNFNPRALEHLEQINNEMKTGKLYTHNEVFPDFCR